MGLEYGNQKIQSETRNRNCSRRLSPTDTKMGTLHSNLDRMFTDSDGLGTLLLHSPTQAWIGSYCNARLCIVGIVYFNFYILYRYQSLRHTCISNPADYKTGMAKTHHPFCRTSHICIIALWWHHAHN